MASCVCPVNAVQCHLHLLTRHGRPHKQCTIFDLTARRGTRHHGAQLHGVSHHHLVLPVTFADIRTNCRMIGFHEIERTTNKTALITTGTTIFKLLTANSCAGFRFGGFVQELSWSKVLRISFSPRAEKSSPEPLFKFDNDEHSLIQSWPTAGLFELRSTRRWFASALRR